MNQAASICLLIKSTLNDSSVDTCLQGIYYALLTERYVVKKCKKRWLKQHYIIQLWDAKYLDYQEIHLTPDRSWIKCYY